MWRVGHRGACGYAPENTLKSMRKALEIGVHGFEFDIQMSADNEPVVMHDDTLDRTTNGKGLVSGYTVEELKRFDAGEGERIPTLRDVIDLVDKRCRLFIELKAEEATYSVADIIENSVKNLGWNYEQFFVCSFNHLQIAHIRAINPNIRTCALFVGIPINLAQLALDAGAWSINPSIHHINQSLVDDAHIRGLKVLVWTANNAEEISKARKLGVDGIISNFPDKV